MLTHLFHGLAWWKEGSRAEQEGKELARRLVLEAIETFGPGRCMWASNWPVDTGAFALRDMFAFFEDISSGFSTENQSSLFQGAARAAYGLS